MIALADADHGANRGKQISHVAADFCTFELMRASAERLMSCLFQAGLAADGATSGGGAAFGPAAWPVPVS